MCDSKKFHLDSLNCDYVVENPGKGEFLVKVRSTGGLLPCKILENGTKVLLEKGEGGVSPGQACVFYKKDDLGVRVFGGGWIKKTEK